MERSDGIRKFLKIAWVYELFQAIACGRSGMTWLCANHWKIEPGMLVVDVGCGTAKLRSQFPEDIKYYGFDPNVAYIESAKDKDVELVAGGITEFLQEFGEGLAGKIDVVVCSGVLHHLTSEQVGQILNGANLLLKPGGRFAALEPAFLVRQDRFSRWILEQDRGTNILYDYEWRKEMEAVFDSVDIRVANNLIRIPYMYALITAWKE